MPDDRTNLVDSIRFALRHKVTAPDTRKILRALDHAAITRLADDVAGHILMCGWEHPPTETGRREGVTPPAPFMHAADEEMRSGMLRAIRDRLRSLHV